MPAARVISGTPGLAVVAVVAALAFTGEARAAGQSVAERDLRAAECGLTHRPSDGAAFHPEAPCVSWDPVQDSRLAGYYIYRTGPGLVDEQCLDSMGSSTSACLRRTRCIDGPATCIRAYTTDGIISVDCSNPMEVWPCACLEVEGRGGGIVKACEVECWPGAPDRLRDEAEVGPCP